VDCRRARPTSPLTYDEVWEVSIIAWPDREWGEVVVAYVVGEATAAEPYAL
jgi:long-chain acyl-CoA synthetase